MVSLKIKLFIFLLIATGLTGLIYIKYKDQKVQILYFNNDKCIVDNLTDKLIRIAKEDFEDRIEVQEYNVSLYVGDPPDSEEVKQIRKQYNVTGAPMILINEMEYKKEYKVELFRSEICKIFVIKPLVCL